MDKKIKHFSTNDEKTADCLAMLTNTNPDRDSSIDFYAIEIGVAVFNKKNQGEIKSYLTYINSYFLNFDPI